MPETTVHTATLTYAESVNRALRRALAEDPTTLLFGEDVALPGGVFGVTKGLQKAFGDRVFDTPISESAILGSAVGAALVGRRPIVEIMWADFALVAFDQIVNQAANVRYINRGVLCAPITIRTQQGSGPGACAQHSQNLEALFAHIPGIEVCMPTTHQDAHDLLLAAIVSDDPTVVIENRNLYHGDKQEVRLGVPVVGQRSAAVRRPGRDITIVTWGATQRAVLDAAETLHADHGISAEVIDMRWLRPLDVGAVVASVGATGTVAVVHEAHQFAGLGAEVVAAVAESGVPLRRPPLRIATPDTRIPAAPSLLAAVIPSADTVVDRVASLLRSPAPTR